MGSHWFLATIIGFLFFLSVVSTTEKRYDSFVEQAEAESNYPRILIGESEPALPSMQDLCC